MSRAKPKATSESVATTASKLLRAPRASKAVKSVAGSSLTQRQKKHTKPQPVRQFKAGKDL